MNGKIGLTELIFIMAIVLLIFGPSKIGQLGKSLGEGIRNFKSSVKEEEPKKEEENKS
jgi:sec-independent protein translocase protein TatA